MELIRATALDIHHIVKLRVEFLKEISHKNEQFNEVKLSVELLNYLKAHLNHDFVNWFAKEGDQIIATGGICFQNYPPTFEMLLPIRAYIMNVYTIPEYRGRRIASKIFEKLLEEAKKRKVNMVSLHATEKAQRWYEKMGFKSKQNEMVLSLVSMQNPHSINEIFRP